MSFTLTADNLADALAPHLEARPEVTVLGDRLLVGAPLSMKVTVQASQLPLNYDVRCLVGLGGLPLHLALMAANEVSLGSGTSARTRVFPNGDGISLLVEAGISGPIVPGEEFARAIQVVLDGVAAFDRAARGLTRLTSVFAAAEQAGWTSPGNDGASASQMASSAPVPGPQPASVAAPALAPSEVSSGHGAQLVAGYL